MNVNDRLSELCKIYLGDSWDRSYHRAAAQTRWQVDLMQALLIIASDLRDFRLAGMKKMMNDPGEMFRRFDPTLSRRRLDADLDRYSY